MSYVLQFRGKEINGDTHGHYYSRLRTVAVQAGWTFSELNDLLVVPATLERVGLGLTNFLTREITITTIVPPNMQVRILSHELGHALVGRPDLVWPDNGQEQRIIWSEVVAESVALRVCHGIRLNILDVSAGYLQSFPRPEIERCLNANDHLIHTTADYILEAVA